MKFRKLVSALLILGLAIIQLTGCEKKENISLPEVTQSELNITFSDEEYGDNWLKSIVDEYKKLYPDLKVNINNDRNISSNVTSILENTNSIPDIIILPYTNWQYWASKNYLENLNSVYDSDIDIGKTFAYKMDDDIKKTTKLNDDYYIVPLDKEVEGFIYNKRLFEKYNWQIPTNMQEFNELLIQIKNENIIPIAWSGESINKWDIIVKNWWAKYEGSQNIADYLNVYDSSVYEQKGREESLDQFDLIAKDTTNTFENVMDTDDKKALNMFLSGKAAMIIADTSIDLSAKDKTADDFEMDFLDVPAIEGSSDPNLIVLPQGQIMIIPKLADNKDEAKRFIKFMSCDSILRMFNELTSTQRPFLYDFDDETDSRTQFAKNTNEYLKNKHIIYFSSNNPIYYNELSDWPKTGMPYLRLFLNDTTPFEVINQNLSYVEDNFDKLREKYAKD